MNSRLDTLQAAILLEKLAIFDEEIAAASGSPSAYAEGLADAIVVPQLLAGVSSRLGAVHDPHTARGDACRRLKAGLPTAVYYPVPLHRQPAFRSYPQAADGLPAADGWPARC